MKRLSTCASLDPLLSARHLHDLKTSVAGEKKFQSEVKIEAGGIDWFQKHFEKHSSMHLSSLIRATSDGAPHSSLSQLFRNLWFYIALLGLGPPLPNAAPSVPRPLTKGTAKLVNTSMHAVLGPYAYPAVWIEAVETIAEGTPPLVVSLLVWACAYTLFGCRKRPRRWVGVHPLGRHCSKSVFYTRF